MMSSNKAIKFSECDEHFKYEVAGAHKSAHDLNACFTCGTCTAGCPIHRVYPDYNPMKIVRMIQLGMKERVLSSEYIWYCATCHTCEQRCPQKVNFFNVLNVVKNMAVQEGYAAPAWISQTKQLMQTGIVFPIENKWVKNREALNLPPLQGEGKKITKLLELGGLDKRALRGRV